MTRPPVRPSAASLAMRLRELADTLEKGAARSLEMEVGAALDFWDDALADLPRGRAAGRAEQRPPAPAGGKVLIWCDGSCSPNPGPGGWGAIVEADGARRELSGASPASTNNIMEMTAALEALRTTEPGAEVELTTDSEYLRQGITQWIRAWKRNGWRTAGRTAVKNQELWRELDVLAGARTVRWHWVAGHSGHPENERCDELANAARRAQGRQ
jgi:ribonuclease HI